MTIASCTSCQPSGYAQAMRERQRVNRSNDIAIEQAFTQERQRMQEYFNFDPSRILDIQA